MRLRLTDWIDGARDRLAARLERAARALKAAEAARGGGMLTFGRIGPKGRLRVTIRRARPWWKRWPGRLRARLMGSK